MVKCMLPISLSDQRNGTDQDPWVLQRKGCCKIQAQLPSSGSSQLRALGDGGTEESWLRSTHNRSLCDKLTSEHGVT